MFVVKERCWRALQTVGSGLDSRLNQVAFGCWVAKLSKRGA
jgi:hypothetical protein